MSAAVFDTMGRMAPLPARHTPCKIMITRRAILVRVYSLKSARPSESTKR